MYLYMHETKRSACLLSLYPLLRYYDTPIILLGLTSGIRTTSPQVLAPTTRRVAMMIAAKDGAVTTATAAIRQFRKLEGRATLSTLTR